MAKNDVESTKTVTLGSRLIGMIERATEEDFEELRADIRKQERILASLKRAEYMIGVTLGKISHKKGPYTKKKKAEAVAAPGEIDDLADKRKRVANLLKGGARNGADIIRLCNIQPAQLATVVQCEYFSQTSNGWHLTPKGRQTYC